jgi:hypothetical protein
MILAKRTLVNVCAILLIQNKIKSKMQIPYVLIQRDLGSEERRINEITLSFSNQTFVQVKIVPIEDRITIELEYRCPLNIFCIPVQFQAF